jgi:hypothetical protein
MEPNCFLWKYGLQETRQRQALQMDLIHNPYFVDSMQIIKLIADHQTLCSTFQNFHEIINIWLSFQNHYQPSWSQPFCPEKSA